MISAIEQATRITTHGHIVTFISRIRRRGAQVCTTFMLALLLIKVSAAAEQVEVIAESAAVGA